MQHDDEYHQGYMAARDKLCPARELEWGGEECWGEAADPGSRWRVLLQYGCLERVELRRWEATSG